MVAKKRSNEELTVVKKYANRRLYDTGRSSYVTLDDLCNMIREGHDFVVYDAKSGEDLTRQVLTQIIVDQESRSEFNMLPINFLRQLIGLYGDTMQAVVPDYLEHALDNFVCNQEKLREQINTSLEGMFPARTMDKMNRENMAMFQNAMRAMKPFAFQEGNEDASNQNSGSNS
jgi:polyhydroxyalkanoate synthesis repressor PhaR